MQDRFRRREIEIVLAAELQAAQEAFRSAVSRQSEIMERVPSGIPAPDSNLRLELAARERGIAYAALQVAIARWKDFASRGIVPEDLAADASHGTAAGDGEGFSE
jgi:hypothetical protein